MSDKPRISELNLVRGFAIAAVLLIHATSSATLLPPGTVIQAICLTLNRASLFTVPLFIWISGVVLFYNYYEGWQRGATLGFLRKRLRKIAVPYAAWTLFYYVYNQWMYHGSVTGDVVYLLKLLVSGNASYHLYYIVIIAQFYILFPFAVRWAAASKRLERSLVWAGLAVQVAFYGFQHGVFPLPHAASLFPGYAAMFAFGAYTGIHYRSMLDWLERNKKLVYALFPLIGALLAGMFLLHQFGLVKLASAWFELVLLLYSFAAALFFLRVSRMLAERGTRLVSALRQLGAASFGIYLVHPALLTVWNRLWPPPGAPLPALLHAAGACCAALLGAWALVWLYGRLLQMRPQAPISASR